MQARPQQERSKSVEEESLATLAVVGMLHRGIEDDVEHAYRRGFKHPERITLLREAASKARQLARALDSMADWSEQA